MKIGIIGLGMVGKEVLLNLYRTGIADSIYILDLNQEKTLCEIMDLEDTIPFGLHRAFTRLFTIQDYSELSKCDFVIINVNIANKNMAGDRLTSLHDNSVVMKKIAKNFIGSESTFIITSNPVDLMAQVFVETSGINPKKVIGSGTYLDTARLQVYLSQHFSVSADCINTFVLGEHGNSSMIAWSLTQVAGLAIDDYSSLSKMPPVDKDKALSFTRERGFAIFKNRGYTDHGIGAAVCNIVEAMARDSHKIIPISTMMMGEYNLNNIYLSVPCLIGKNGVINTLPLTITNQEEFELHQSAKALQLAYNSLI